MADRILKPVLLRQQLPTIRRNDMENENLAGRAGWWQRLGFRRHRWRAGEQQPSRPLRPARTPGQKLSVCLISPRFEPSYWGFNYALPLYPGDKRSTMINGALPTVAALCGDHHVDLLDENVEDIDWESLREYDLVGVTGMNVQKARCREILLRLREMHIFTAVGGPLVSVQAWLLL